MSQISSSWATSVFRADLVLEATLEIAHERDVPVIVDAAAETDLHKYIAAGADLVIYSGHKSFNAPTSGIVAGRRDLIDACLQQNDGIGRTMKIGKEDIINLRAYDGRNSPANGIDPKAYTATGMLSYVTGSHAMKAGFNWTFGDYVLEYDINGDMVQRYRSGVPDSVCWIASSP